MSNTDSECGGLVRAADLPPGARKDDQGKAPWHLLPYDAVSGVVAVLAFGAKKYAAHGWRHVPNGRERYFSALQRHLVAWWGGESRDPESGLRHLEHAATNALFLLALELDSERGVSRDRQLSTGAE